MGNILKSIYIRAQDDKFAWGSFNLEELIKMGMWGRLQVACWIVSKLLGVDLLDWHGEKWNDDELSGRAFGNRVLEAIEVLERSGVIIHKIKNDDKKDKGTGVSD